MPYDARGEYVTVRPSLEHCRCASCREYRRVYGQSPADEYLDSLEQPVYNLEGYDQYGFDRDGFDQDGWDHDRFDREGFNRTGYDRYGYDREGYNENGYDLSGFDRNGFDNRGYDENGYNFSGYSRYGYDRNGFDYEGYNRQGYNHEGYDRDGFNMDGRDREGYDRAGYNEAGFNRAGEQRPCDCYDCKVERGEAERVPLVTVADVDTPFERPDDDDYDRYDDERAYPEYHDERQGQWGLRSYSYTPDPLIFRRKHGENQGKVPFYGMEIEMSSNLTLQEERLGERQGMRDNLLYFKQDGSVEGFEMVSHPMTARWAAENFPWQVVEVLHAAGATVRPSENGLHVHVSRSGFNHEAHLYSWIKFWYRNQRNIINRAGRAGGSWGGFNTDHRQGAFAHAKFRAQVRHGSYRGSSPSTGSRYSVINLTNENTVEVRICAATTSAQVLRYRFEMVAASVEYTRTLTVKDIVSNGGWSWDKFVTWLAGRADEYPALAVGEGVAQRTAEPALSLA